MLRFEDARLLVIQEAGRQLGPAKTITKNVWEALGFVLAQEIRTDRLYPPFDRATRDGYAVRASEAGAGETIRCGGEIKAGDTVTVPLAARSCVQIMTGAAVPTGADAVVMIEFTLRTGDAVTFQRDTKPGQNIVRRGS
jgi:molybdopterin molybdotransferase